MIYLQVAGLILIIVVLSYQIMHKLSLATGHYGLFRIVLFPGIAFHEAAHLLACWLTNTPVTEINLWTATGGHVVHHKPRLPFVQPIISFAPFLAGLTLIVILSRFFNGPWWQMAIVAYAIAVTSATLAPSKSDVGPALEGTLLILFLAGGSVWAYPSLSATLEPFFDNLLRHLLYVAAIMTGVWLLVASISQFRRG